MKKILITTFITFLLSAGLIFNYASADLDFGQGEDGLLKVIATQSNYETSGGDTQLSGSVGRIIRVVLSLVGMIFFALAVYAGFLWMTASGNDEQVTKATNILKAATIGLIIALAGFSISVFITSKTLESTQSLSVPTTVGATVQQSSCTDNLWTILGAGVNYVAEGAYSVVDATAQTLGCGFGLVCDIDPNFDDPCDPND